MNVRIRRRRCSRRRRRLQAGIGRHVNQHRRVADSPRAQKEFFKLTIDTVTHRPDADAVGVDFGGNAPGAIVDGEIISTWRQRILERRSRGLYWKCLRYDVADLVIDHSYFAIRLLAIRCGRILAEERINYSVDQRWIVLSVARRVGLIRSHFARKSSRVRPRYDRRQIAVHNLKGGRAAVGHEHFQDRRAVRIFGAVVNNRVPVGTNTFRGQLQVLLRHLTAVPLSACRLYVQSAKQSARQLVALSAGITHRVKEKSSLVLNVKLVLPRSAGAGQTRRIGADQRTIIRGCRRPFHGHRICKFDIQTVADVRAENQRPGPLSRLELQPVIDRLGV